MSTIRYNSFTEFYNDFKHDFSQTANQRLSKWWSTISGLPKGCGCSRKARIKSCHKEYLKSSIVLSQTEINIMKMKNPNKTYEFADGDAVFFTIPPVGDPFPLWKGR